MRAATVPGGRIMVVNPGRSQWDPGGAERSGALPGRDGMERRS
ncbi:hypothetical protein A2U01_0024912 [Trifolium medium]|uniref:Uncharacterized protein n=1 Tax=Trifolium medium TaxID=97028 RepID=A0A392NVM6_9FABA|nr:hypothetical protein [Trifolium medium]